MNKIMIHKLPEEVTDGQTVLRHWLMMEDGRIFYQDENLSVENVTLTSKSEGVSLQQSGIGSIRGDWVQLPTPPAERRLVSLCPAFKDDSGIQQFALLYSDGSVGYTNE